MRQERTPPGSAASPVTAPPPSRLSLFIFQPFFSPPPPQPLPIPPCVSFSPTSPPSLPQAPPPTTTPHPPVLASFPSSGSPPPTRAPGRGVPARQIPPVCRGSPASVSALRARAIGPTPAASPSMHHSERATNEHGRRNAPAPSLALFSLFFIVLSLNRGTICWGSKAERVAWISAQMTTDCLCGSLRRIGHAPNAPSHFGMGGGESSSHMVLVRAQMKVQYLLAVKLVPSRSPGLNWIGEPENVRQLRVAPPPRHSGLLGGQRGRRLIPGEPARSSNNKRRMPNEVKRKKVYFSPQGPLN